MKLQFMLTFQLFVISAMLAQNDKTIFLCNQVIDTLPYKQQNIERNIFYKLEELETLNEEYIFRSWAGNSCVEIIKSGNSLSGKIYFAVEGFDTSEKNKHRFAKAYELSNEVSLRIFSLIENYEFVRRKHPSGMIPVVHTFEIKENSNIETYTTDSLQFEYKIFDIIPMNIYWDKFEKEMPFKKYTYWELIVIAENENEIPLYLTK